MQGWCVSKDALLNQKAALPAVWNSNRSSTLDHQASQNQVEITAKRTHPRSVRAGLVKLQEAKLLQAKSQNNMYFIEYTVTKPAQEQKHLMSAVALGFNGRYGVIRHLGCCSYKAKRTTELVLELECSCVCCCLWKKHNVMPLRVHSR